MDGDGIDNPYEIGNLIAPLIEKKADVVTARTWSNGSRFLANPERLSVMTKLSNSIITAVIRILTGKRITDNSSGYRAMKKTALKRLELRSNGLDIDTEIVIKSLREGLLFKEVPVRGLPLRFYFKGKYRYIGSFTLLREVISVAQKRQIK